MNEAKKSNLKAVLVETVLPSAIVSAIGVTAICVLYNKHNVRVVSTYANFLQAQNDLFAKSLDQTTNAIIEQLQKK